MSMTSKLLKNIVRIFGLISSVLLVIQPWFYTTGSDDPFLYSSWNILCSGFLGSVLLSVILVFYKPRKNQVPFIMIFFMFFIAVIFSAHNASYLTTLRSAMLVVNSLLLLVFLRLARFEQDNHALVSTVAVSGAFMGVYSILQSFGYDFFDWNVKYNAVGTLANTNYAGIYLIISALVTLGATLDISCKNWKAKGIFVLMLVLQIAGALYCRKLGINITLALSLGLFVVLGYFERYPGKYIGRQALLSGLLMAIFLVSLYGLAYYKINSYTWESVVTTPKNRSTAARLILWKMGFEVFLKHPILGVGPGALPYEIQINRLPNADVFGINEYNPDPHAVPISLLAEFGLLGFWLICSFFCMTFGIYIKRRSLDFEKFECAPVELIEAESTADAPVIAEVIEATKVVEEVEVAEAVEATEAAEATKVVETVHVAQAAEVTETTEVAETVETAETAETSASSEAAEPAKEPKIKEKSKWDLPWFLTFIILLIIYLAYRSKFISMPVAFYSLPFVVAFAGIFNLFVKVEEDDKDDYCASRYQARGVLTALLAYGFYSLFNNSFDAVPVSGLVILIISLMFSFNLKDVRWKRHFSAFSLFYLLLPILFAFVAYRLQLAHHIEYVNLYRGRILLGASRPKDAAECFAVALKQNPQSLKAIHGAALGFEMLGLDKKAQEMYKKLDLIVPNAFGANYYLAKTLLESGNILEAHKYALKNLERERLPTAFELLGRVLIIEGKHGEAEGVLKEGLEFIPNFYHEKLASDRIRFTLANYAVGRGDYRSARIFLDAMVTTYKNEKSVRYIDGMLNLKEGKQEEATNIFEGLLKEEPNNPNFMNAVGFLLTRKGEDLERAQELLESAHVIVKAGEPVELSSLLMIAHSLGKLYWKQNKLNEAGDLLRIAYEQTPDDWTSLKEERKKDLATFEEQAQMEAKE